MADLQEKQYELGDVVFGLDCPVAVAEDGWTPGSAEITSADVKRAAGDGVRFGKDRRGSATWSFSMFTTAQGDDAEVAEREAWEAIGQLATAWAADDVRLTSGAVIPLRYCVAGQTRRIYGRPRRFTTSPNNASLVGNIAAVGDFATVDDLVYEDEQYDQIVRLSPPPDATAGFIPPFIAPLTTTPRSEPRQSAIVVGGSVPTPATVVITGPVSAARVQVAGWVGQLIDPVIPGDPVTFDSRPWVNAVTKQSGGGVKVSPRVTRISRLWLPPGNHEVVFTGVDPTGTATATVSWHNAHRSPR